MDDSDIAKLCKKIYENHQQALDLIFEHRPDLQSYVFDQIMDEIKNTEKVILDKSTKTEIRFSTPELESMAAQQTGDGSWTPSKRLVLFQLTNKDSGVYIQLIIGPGTDQSLRELLFNKANISIIIKGKKTLTPKWSSIHRFDLVNKEEIRDLTSEGIVEKLIEKWTQFIDEELPEIQKVLIEN
ncbi:MAG: hypothetical protein B6241_10355 [Spirochaetaceae bacterium 4572_59]|nr:MAG: hypothetical protein B6241_10355 [Spirochaetaceae bacterium 4572_59]